MNNLKVRWSGYCGKFSNGGIKKAPENKSGAQEMVPKAGFAS
jgi:hypothetical protein